MLNVMLNMSVSKWGLTGNNAHNWQEDGL